MIATRPPGPVIGPVAGAVAGTTPYAWPYDGPLVPQRVALLVVTSPGSPRPGTAVAELAGRVLEVGGEVVQVATSPPPRAEGQLAPPLPWAPRRVESAGVDGFYGSVLDHLLRRAGRDQLLLAGGWLETGVHSTMRSANDRGYECLLVLDACQAVDETLRAAARSQIEMSGGIFGAVGAAAAVLDALAEVPVPERNH